MNYTPDFEEFWAKMPNKKGKDKAFRWWRRKKPSKNMIQLMGERLELQKREKEWFRSRRLFCPEWPYGSTWFNSKRWEDELDERFQKHLQYLEERPLREKANIERNRAEMRKEYGQFYREQSLETLRNMRMDEKLTTHWWLINEIIGEK